MQIHTENNIKPSLAICAQPYSQTRTDLSSYPLGKGRKMGDFKKNKKQTQTLLLSHYGVFFGTNRYLMVVLLRIS